MSQVLSSLIQAQLKAQLKAIPLASADPALAAQQVVLANAIATAVQAYLTTSVTVQVATPAGPGAGKLTAP
jgi:hypothetical protein